MKLERKYVEMERNMAVDGAVRWIDDVIATFERAVRDANGYKSRFLDSIAETDAGKNGATKPEEVLSWLVNSTTTPAANLRLDMAVTHGARLSEAYRKVKALAEAEKEAEVAERSATARWMLTGHRTVLPSLKSARFVAEKGLRPEVIHLGTFEACYERARELKGGRYNATAQEVLNSYGRLPVVVTDDWTYHVVEVRATDDAKI
jgi:hypothetical protein